MKKKFAIMRQRIYNVFKVKNITQKEGRSKLNIKVTISSDFLSGEFMGSEPKHSYTKESEKKRLGYIKKTLFLYDDILKDKNKEWIKELRAMLLLKDNRHEDDVYLKGFISAFIKIDEWMEDLRAESDSKFKDITIQDGLSN